MHVLVVLNDFPLRLFLETVLGIFIPEVIINLITFLKIFDRYLQISILDLNDRVELLCQLTLDLHPALEFQILDEKSYSHYTNQPYHELQAYYQS